MRWRSATRLCLVLFAVAFGTNVPTPLLLIYREELGLSTNALTGAFGLYAAGLVPALLLAGPASDRFGRRAVTLPFVVLSLVVSLLFLGAASSVPVLFACRFLQGAVSGVVFSVGTAWLAETVDVPAEAARLATIALGGGWAAGPLLSGLLGQWLPLPTVLPYLLHVLLMIAGLVLVRGIPETLAPAGRRRGPLIDLGVPRRARAAFVLVVVPIALGVFTFPTVCVTVLPLLLVPAMPGFAVAVTGAVSGACLGSGVLAQPLASRLGPGAAGPVAIGLGAVGLALSLLVASLGAWPLLIPVALLLGVAYGLCMAAGLTLVGQLADSTARGALTGTFYCCAYLGFGVPLLLSASGGAAGFTGPLTVLTVVSAAVALALSTPPLRGMSVTRQRST